MALKGSTYNDRAETAAQAKKAMMERFQSRPKADDPRIQALAAERLAVAQARAARIAEKKRLKDEAEALAAEEARLKATEEARMAAEETRRLMEARARELEILARDTARDSRYPARKTRR